MKPLHKKGFQLVEIPSMVIVLVTIAIVIGLAATVLNNMSGVSGMVDASTSFDENVSFTASNISAVDFTPSDILYDAAGNAHLITGSCTSVALRNTSADVTSLFTISGCTAVLDAGESSNGTSVLANYTYRRNVYNTNFNITTEGLDSQAELSGWQSTWVVIIAAAVVIGLVGRYLFFSS